MKKTYTVPEIKLCTMPLKDTITVSIHADGYGEALDFSDSIWY
ncbi:MAG: hypothetical protein ACI3XQ_04530 [Eubacteriales bacterium]